jgi:hypothetical protein
MKQGKIITLYTFKDILEGTLAVDKLKVNNIESILQDETTSGINPLGGIELKVFSKDKEKANKIIVEFKNLKQNETKH